MWPDYFLNRPNWAGLTPLGQNALANSANEQRPGGAPLPPLDAARVGIPWRTLALLAVAVIIVKKVI